MRSPALSSKEQLDAPSAPRVKGKPSESLTHSESAAPESTNVATAASEQQKKTNQQTPFASIKDSPERPSSEEQQADRPSARRERKQTAFFQPEIKVETAKLEIKEVNVGRCIAVIPAGLDRAVLLLYRDKVPSLAIFQTVSVATTLPCTAPMPHAATPCAMLQLLFILAR